MVWLPSAHLFYINIYYVGPTFFFHFSFLYKIINSSSTISEPYLPFYISVNMSFAIKPLNLQGGQCSWCGKYGHKRPSCPLLK
ncbi:uncharacterized protein BYT42DRAFT_589643 [Radiomyces spectabilis]|uniref:uncharacterized protein n=1 Tax=Radiomyces spectabilis TaxID=64574 RepID=UPI00221FF817|nr:uncharacterized protein BYT42DRAFT_589643 [Radiomyces spectabilis]KAI8365359.1 hypothetical protein BYT42DRAFT_589643 [Radiomyces spectabilis]